jgi:DNA-directed RNA polymerase specialized sigma24 family protein
MATEAERRREIAARFRNPLTTPEQREEISRRYIAGEGRTRIANAMGLKETTVRNYCPPRNPYT